MKHAAILHFSLLASEWSVVIAVLKGKTFTKDRPVFPLQVQQALLNHKPLGNFYYPFPSEKSLSPNARRHPGSFYPVFRFVWSV